MQELTKVINHLQQYVGHEVIRTLPACGDWSYTDDPVLLVGFTSDGQIRYLHTGFHKKLLGDQELVLPIHFTDSNWITYKDALKAEGNELNKWIGKKIIRTHPTSLGDFSYMDGDNTLISASKSHMVVETSITGKVVLNSQFNNPTEWQLAE